MVQRIIRAGKNFHITKQTKTSYPKNKQLGKILTDVYKFLKERRKND